MLDFNALYAQPDPAGALCRAVLTDLPGTGGGAPVLIPVNAPRVCTTPGCGRPLSLHSRSRACARCKDAARYQASKRPCPGGCGRQITQQSNLCSSCARRAVAARKRAVAAAVPAESATLPVAPPPCPATPDGRHQMAFFGGLPLPGQPIRYCMACQPRERGHKTDYFSTLPA